MFFKTIFIYVLNAYKFLRKKLNDFSTSLVSKDLSITKIPRMVTESICTFFGEHFRLEKKKFLVSVISFILILSTLIATGSISKVAIYINGKKIGYVENEDEAVQIIEEYNDFANENYGKTDIILQNEISLSQSLLSSGDLQNTIDGVKNEEFTNAYMLYFDDALIAVTESPDVLRNVISQIESDVTALLGNNASIYNSIQIKNEFYPTSQLSDPAKLYSTIVGVDTITRNLITPSVILSDNNEPIKLYSLNGILFETYEYYKVERYLKSETVFKNDDAMYKGSQKLITVGNDGAAIDFYKRTIFEGEVQNTELIDTNITTAKVDTVILTGTKEINWKEDPKILLFPLGTNNFRYSSEFGGRSDPFTGEYAYHSGIDLGCASGTSVLAADSGIVVTSTNSDGSAGTYISILHDNGLTTTYMHLSKRLVKVGDRVYAGQQIALSGNTGRSTGPHLHFTVLDVNGNLVNPRRFTQFP